MIWWITKKLSKHFNLSNSILTQRRNGFTKHSELNEDRRRVSQQRRETEDSYYDEEVKKEIVKKKKDRNYFGYDPKSKYEKEKYYKRIEDLNKLQTKILLDSDKSVNNKEMNEIFYKFKKRK